MDEKKFMASELAAILKIPLSKVRRNIGLFFKPDPIARRRSGYSRKFVRNDAFLIYLSAVLLSQYAFCVDDVKRFMFWDWPVDRKFKRINGRVVLCFEKNYSSEGYVQEIPMDQIIMNFGRLIDNA